MNNKAEEKTAAGNSRFAKVAEQCSEETFVVNQNNYIFEKWKINNDYNIKLN